MKNILFLRICLVLSMLNLMSCSNKKDVFIKGVFSKFDKLSLNDIVSAETKRGSIDKTPSNLVEIGESIYPNNNKYVLATPKTYQLLIEKEFETQVEYFYSANDSMLKVILYEWSPEYRNMPNLFGMFQEKFKNLSNKMTKELGNPIEVNIEENKNQDSTFRDDVKWRSKDGMNAYLFMFGNDGNNFREIRLALYKD